MSGPRYRAASPQRRQITEMLEMDGRTVAEIVEELGCSRQTVDRAIEALRDEGRLTSVREPTGRQGRPRQRYSAVTR